MSKVEKVSIRSDLLAGAEIPVAQKNILQEKDSRSVDPDMGVAPEIFIVRIVVIDISVADMILSLSALEAFSSIMSFLLYIRYLR